MKLVDISQIFLANIDFANLDVNLVRHTTLNTLASYRQKFKNTYGDMIICCDDKNFWRKNVFAYYKAGRKTKRDASTIDWNGVFDIIHTLKAEFREYLPYKIIQVEQAEADDIIGTLCKIHGSFNIHDPTQILIISSDKDFLQLQKYQNVSQWSPLKKEFLDVGNPESFLREHIMLGDPGDGIPNFLSNDNTFVAGDRQKPLSRKKLESWIKLKPEDFCDDNMLRGYKRNEMLIDLELIPEPIANAIKEEYNNYTVNPRSKLLEYFTTFKLRKLTERITDF